MTLYLVRFRPSRRLVQWLPAAVFLTEDEAVEYRQQFRHRWQSSDIITLTAFGKLADLIGMESALERASR